jgi:hypothetical protein
MVSLTTLVLTVTIAVVRLACRASKSGVVRDRLEQVRLISPGRLATGRTSSEGR